MPDVLHIHASPKQQLSASKKLADAFLSHYKRLHPSDTVRHINLFDVELPAFGFDETVAKFAPIFGETPSDQQQAKWQQITQLIHDFDRADKVVLSSPMWNGSIPYTLKHYIDILVQPLISFGFDANTGEHFGLLRDRPIQLILTRSSVAVGDPFDHQLPYLKSIFEFIGLKNQRVIVADATTQPTAEERERYIDGFLGQAQSAAECF